MSEKTKGVIYLIIFVIAIVSISVFLNYQNKLRKQDEISKQQNDSTNTQSYVTEVNDQTFETEVLKSNKKVLVDFYATWCGPCSIIKPRINAVAKEHPEIKVVSVDVDNAPNLSDKYGIYSIPTLVVIEGGNEVNRAVGAIEKDKIVEILGLK